MMALQSLREIFKVLGEWCLKIRECISTLLLLNLKSRNFYFPSFCIPTMIVIQLIQLGEQRYAENIFAIVIRTVPITIRTKKCLQMS